MDRPSYSGQALWVQVAHRFGPRLPEWFLAVVTALLGLVLLLPEVTFEQPSWAGFRTLFGDENLLGWIMVLLGLLRLVGLIVNGARKHVTPRIRQVSAGVGCLIFVGWACAFAASGVISTWLAVYPAFAVLELANILRASKDVGESSGPT
jgi:cation transport ATPase